MATNTLVDPLGRTTETRDYDNGTATGAYTAVDYRYDAKSRLAQITDEDGNSWHYGYDLLGRKTSTTDPDGGTSTTTYDDLNQVTSTTDSRGKTLSYAYDELGRKTGEYDGTVQDADHQLAKWTYDTIAKGQPSASIRYVGGSGTGGKAYTSQTVRYDALYHPTFTRVTVPSVAGEEALAGTYSFGAAYNLDGTQYSATDPAAGGLPSESEVFGYNELGMPTSLKGASGYVLNTVYTKPGDVSQVTLGTSTADSAKWVQISNTYEDGTRHLDRQLVTDDTDSAPVQDTHYTYDDSGNPTSVDTRADGVNDTQCYRYDGHDRLTQAWTPTNGCAADPSQAMLGGPAPYWQTYGYDPVGDRTTLVDHGATSGASDKTTTYTYPVPGTDQPHTLDSSVTTQSGQSDTTASYAYDKAGNTTTRTVNGKTQHLEWDDEGNLAKVTNADGTSVSYLYDADGNRLLSRDTSGTTLYLGDMEIHLASGASTATGTRYYAWAGQTVAVRTSDGKLDWVLTDRHDTASTQIDNTTQSVVRRYTDPYGNARGPGADPSSTTDPDSTDWLGDKGFVGGIQDTGTGLTHLGARDYDTTTGRFISLDPLLQTNISQTINGYTYAADNPITSSDPTGEGLACGGPGMPGCGSGVVTHGDGSLSHNGKATGGGTASHYAGYEGGGSYHPTTHKSCWFCWKRVGDVGSSIGHGIAHVAKAAYHAVTKHPVMALATTGAVLGGALCFSVLVEVCGGPMLVGAAVEAGVGEGATVAAEGAAAGVEESASAEGAGEAASEADATASEGSADSSTRASESESGKCSFAPSTPVLMDHGRTKTVSYVVRRTSRL